MQSDLSTGHTDDEAFSAYKPQSISTHKSSTLHQILNIKARIHRTDFKIMFMQRSFPSWSTAKLRERSHKSPISILPSSGAAISSYL